MQKKIKGMILPVAVIVIGVAIALVSILIGAGIKKRAADNASPSEDVDASGALAQSGEGSVFNVLLTASDRTSGLTDVMMLVSLDRVKNTVTVMQIPRDTYASYTGDSYRKLNGAYKVLGGADGLRDFLSQAFSIKIDRYLMLSPDAFRSVVDAVGGVEIDLPRALYYYDPAQNYLIDLPAGKQRLNGEMAEQFVRYRSGYADGDLGRIDAQKLFLSAFFEQVKENMSPATLAKLASSVIDGVDSDFLLSDAISLSGELLSLDPENIFFVTAPGEAAVARSSGASYYVLSSKGTGEILREYFGASGEFDRGRVFLNSGYSNFRSIYEGYTEYELYSAKNISGGVLQK